MEMRYTYISVNSHISEQTHRTTTDQTSNNRPLVGGLSRKLGEITLKNPTGRFFNSFRKN